MSVYLPKLTRYFSLIGDNIPLPKTPNVNLNSIILCEEDLGITRGKGVFL